MAADSCRLLQNCMYDAQTSTGLQVYSVYCLRTRYENVYESAKQCKIYDTFFVLETFQNCASTYKLVLH